MSTLYDELGNVIYSDDGPIVDTGNTGSNTNYLSVDYYRSKVLEFQQTLVLMDETYNALYSVMDVVMQDDAAYDEWFGLLDALNSKRTQMKVVAEAINLASTGINATGVSFPKVTLPAGLQIAPVVGIAAAAAATAAAVALIVWAKQFWLTVRDALKRWQTLDAIKSLPEADRADALALLQSAEEKVEVARAQADGSSLNSVASLAKWAAIGVLAYYGYQMYKDSQHGNRS